MADQRDGWDWDEEQDEKEDGEHDDDQDDGQDDERDDEPHFEVRPRRRQAAGEREFRRERDEQFRQFVRPWNDADDAEAERMLTVWARADHDDDAYWVIYTVLQQRCLRTAVEHLRDEVNAVEIFHTACQELQRTLREDLPQLAVKCLPEDDFLSYSDKQCRVSEDGPVRRRKAKRRKPFVFQGKCRFLAYFERLLKHRCLDVLAGKRPLVRPGGPPPRPLSEKLEGKDGRQRTLEDTIAADTPTPEQILGEKEAKREHSESLKRFKASLSPARLQTWEVMKRIHDQAPGDISWGEMYRRTKEILGISDNALYGRVHHINLACQKCFGEPLRTVVGL